MNRLDASPNVAATQMADTPKDAGHLKTRRSLLYTLVHRWPKAYWLLGCLVGVIYYLGYALVLIWQGEPLANSDLLWARTLGFPVTIAIILSLAMYLERGLEQMLNDLRPAVMVEDTIYAQFVHQRREVTWLSEIVIILTALILGPVAWFSSAASAINWIIGSYVLFGITLVALLTSYLIAAIMRGVRAVVHIQQLPLALDIFDSDDLLPLARLGLYLSIPTAAIAMLMILFWGFELSPIAPYFYASLLTISILAFFVPLINLHRQMVDAKARELEIVQTMVRAAYEQLKNASEVDHRERSQTLANLLAAEARVIAAPTWPFNITVLSQLAATLIIPVALTILQILSSRW